MGCFDHLFVACCHFWAPPCEKHLLASDPSCGNSSGIFSFPAKRAVLCENSRVSLHRGYRVRFASASREGVECQRACRELQCR